jgi:hypothetical protein
MAVDIPIPAFVRMTATAATARYCTDEQGLQGLFENFFGSAIICLQLARLLICKPVCSRRAVYRLVRRLGPWFSNRLSLMVRGLNG